jgi:hypothetical protein
VEGNKNKNQNKRTAGSEYLKKEIPGTTGFEYFKNLGRTIRSHERTLAQTQQLF